MTHLTDEQLKILTACARDEASRDRLIALFNEYPHPVPTTTPQQAIANSYRYLLEIWPDGVMITHRATIAYMNPALVRLLKGKDAGDFVGRDVFAITHAENHDLIQNRINIIGHDNELISQRQERYICQDGTIVDVEVTISPVVLEDMRYSLTLVRDVTRRRQAETALNHFMNQLKILQDVSLMLSNAPSLADFSRLAIEQGRDRLGFDRLTLWFMDSQAQKIIGAYGTSASGEVIPMQHQQRPLTDKFQYVLKNPSTPFGFWESTSLPQETDIPNRRGWYAVFPLRNGDECIGFLVADNYIHQQPAQPQELELLVMYSSTLAYLAARRQAEDALQLQQQAEYRFQEQLKQLNEIIIALPRSNSFEELCYLAVERGCAQLGFDRLSLWLIDQKNNLYLHGTYGTAEDGSIRSEWDSRHYIPEMGSKEQYMVITGQVLHMVIEDAPLLDDQQNVVGRGSQAAAGLYDGQRILGCLYTDNYFSRQPFTQYQIDLLRLYGTALGHIIKAKWTENDLRRSQERYRTIFRRASIGICLVDAQDRIQSSNPAFQTMLGYTTAELQTMTFADFAIPDSPPNLTFFRQLLSEQKTDSYQGETRYKRKDGEIIWVRLDISHFPSNHTEDIQVMVLVQDITDQKLAVSQLQESEARNRALLSAVPDNIFLQSNDGIFLDYHSPAQSSLYTNPENFLNRHMADVLPESALNILSPAFEKTLQSGELQKVEYPILMQNKERMLFESRLVPYGNNRVLSIVRDITEQRLAHERLTESEERFRQIAEHVDDVFFIYDLINKKILYVNPAFEKIWRTDRQSLYKQPLDYIEKVHPDDRYQFAQMKDHIRQSRKTSNEAEYRIVRPDGSIAWLWTRLFEIPDKNGNPYRVVGVTKDITERKLSEQQNLELALQRERVKVISDFIRDASHEFRTPLSIINSKVYLVSHVTDEEQRKEHLAGIQAQTETILKLVESLVTMSRLDSATATTLLPVDINQILRALHINYGDQLQTQQLTLTLDLCDALPYVLANISDLYQAFNNLYDNAIRYTPPDGTITVTSRIDKNQKIIVQINDTGTGISPADAPHIFERFFRGDRAHSTPGFGLGLPMARKIIEHLGGSISVESELGVGSSFTVYLNGTRSSANANATAS